MDDVVDDEALLGEANDLIERGEALFAEQKASLLQEQRRLSSLLPRYHRAIEQLGATSKRVEALLPVPQTSESKGESDG